MLHEIATATPEITPSSKLTEPFEHYRYSLQDTAHASCFSFQTCTVTPTGLEEYEDLALFTIIFP